MNNNFQERNWPTDPEIISKNKIIRDLKEKVIIYESFFRQIHMHRAIILNNDKIIEALDIISLFGTQGSNYETDEELEIRQNKAIEKMRNFK